jgi:hypothetical protein
MPFQCSICTDATKRAFVAERVHQGLTATQIERDTRLPMAADMGIKPVKYETILKHIRHTDDRPLVDVSGGKPPLTLEATPSKTLAPHRPPRAAKAAPVTEFTPGGAVDIATIVQRKAAEGIEKGHLMVTTAHGLQAQKMLDTREDKRKDRELAVNIARLLSGSAGIPAHLIVKDVTPQDVPEDYVPSLPSLINEQPS